MLLIKAYISTLFIYSTQNKCYGRIIKNQLKKKHHLKNKWCLTRNTLSRVVLVSYYLQQSFITEVISALILPNSLYLNSLPNLSPFFLTVIFSSRNIT